MNMAVNIVAINVPSIANNIIVPKYLKKYFFSILIAPSYKIGGSKKSRKNSLKPYYNSVAIGTISVALIKNPAKIPIVVVIHVG